MPKGGSRPGAGRPKGSITEATKERMRVEEAIHARIVGVADRLLNAQLTLAEGVSFLFRIDEIGEGKNKRREHVLVTKPDEIKQFLDETGGSGGISGGNYYYIQTKSPDNKAIDSMFDRTFGKAGTKQALDDEGEPLPPPVTVTVLNAPPDELLRILTAASANSAQRRSRHAKAGRRS